MNLNKMDNFYKLDDLPIYDLQKELSDLIQNKKLIWPNNNQICINTLSTHPDDYQIGCGSLELDWHNTKKTLLADGTEEIHVPKLANPRQESDFDTLCTVFRDTLFDDVYSDLKQKYSIGRIRLMKMKPKTCLSWHIDLCARVHYPIKTQDGCMMIIDQQVCHMPANTWWYTDTHKHHTAINASRSDRIHLVCSVLE